VRASQQLQLGKSDEVVTISLPFLSYLSPQKKHKVFFLVWLCQVRSWIGNSGWGKVSGAKAAPSSRLGLRADAPWRQRHLVTCLQICTSPGERDALITFLVCLAEDRRASLNYRVPDCESLSSLTFQLQICGSCLPARAGSRREALAEAPCSCLGSNLLFAERF